MMVKIRGFVGMCRTLPFSPAPSPPSRFQRFKEKKWDSRRMLSLGGMPSSHSSTVTALAMAIGLQDGPGGSSFAIAVILACVVMYDATGVRLHAGRQAETGTHPKTTTMRNIELFRTQLKSLGFSYDWDREISTTEPEYYKWTQWIFLQLLKRGMAYQAEVPVNWCPALGTVLANEEVVDGLSERGGHPVVRKVCLLSIVLRFIQLKAQGSILPVVAQKPTVELVKVTEAMKSFRAYDKLRLERTNARHMGARLKRAAEAEKE